MFPVTRQVRRKRTRVSGRRGRTRRARARARGSAGENCRGELGSTRTQGGLGGETAWGDRGGLGRQGGLGGAKGRVRMERQGGLGEESELAPDTQSRRWPPDGQAAHPGPTVRSN